MNQSKQIQKVVDKLQKKLHVKEYAPGSLIQANKKRQQKLTKKDVSVRGLM